MYLKCIGALENGLINQVVFELSGFIFQEPLYLVPTILEETSKF